MNKAIGLILPVSLFEKNKLSNFVTDFLVTEHSRYFNDYNFHINKLIFHRSSLKTYAHALADQGYRVFYAENKESSTDRLFFWCKKQGYTTIHCIAPYDFKVEHELHEYARIHNLTLIVHSSDMFLSDDNFLQSQLLGKKYYLMGNFYKSQRKRLNILIENDQPLGGQWSFDAENRKKISPNFIIPPLPHNNHCKFVIEARKYVEKNFEISLHEDSFIYPISHEAARKWFSEFLKHRFIHFGTYEDAILKDQVLLYHSLLSPLLNTGLLTPNFVIEQTLLFAKKNNIALNNTEGFIRQIIGWREFMMGMYRMHYPENINKNFFNHNQKIPQALWQAKTGIDPVDTVIKRVQRYGYAHHIERLMILGNYMLLCEINPTEVYNWFMSSFIDSYEWVMVGNVYSMSQFADGGLMTTKPYLCSANYILKMSDFSKGSWCNILDALYWRFIYKHRDFFAKNPRLNIQSALLAKLPTRTLQSHLILADNYLQYLFKK